MNHKSREGFRCLRLQWLGRFLPRAGCCMFRPGLPVIGWYRQSAKLGFLTSTIIQWCYTLKHFMVVVPNETEAQWLLKGLRPGEIASARQIARLCRKSWSLKHPETSAAFCPVLPPASSGLTIQGSSIYTESRGPLGATHIRQTWRLRQGAIGSPSGVRIIHSVPSTSARLDVKLLGQAVKLLSC